MKIGTEDKKKVMIAGVLGFFGVLAAIYLYGQLFGGPSAPPPAPPVVAVAVTTTKPSVSSKSTAPAVPVIGTAAQKVGTTSGQLDPTLHMEAMLRTEALEYSGSGRNIFGVGPAEPPPPVKMVAANFPARGPKVPLPPPPQQINQVNAPPPINLKFFGTATSENGKIRRAFLLHGDDVILAAIGDVVERRYRIVSITASSILVEDIPNSNKQTLPLIVN